MRHLERPNFDEAEVYDDCVSGIEQPHLAERFATARTAILAQHREYPLKANAQELFSFAASAHGNGTQHVLAGMTKEEFVDLYSTYMVGEGKPARKHYDRLMILAPLGKCPVCGFGHVSTLDHFLAKSRYPAFSVLCNNLVPMCHDCNKDKGSPVVTQNNQTLHPYFESDVVYTERWLFAEIIESVPATVRYFVVPPDSWSGDLAQRIRNHLSDQLAKRFAVEAAVEIVGLSDLLVELGTLEARRAHISTVARVERARLVNSWKAVLYDTLARSEWFQRIGYGGAATPGAAA